MVTKTKYTPQEATRFQHYSGVNSNIVRTVLKCGCKPYEDVFTYNRWKAQGYQVMRGEHSIKLAVIIEKEVENNDGGIEIKKSFANSHVFCRCQVKRIGAPEPEPVKAHVPAPAISTQLVITNQPVSIPVEDKPVEILEGWRLV